MRLLICTQAVDLDDPVLGFFHRWIEEFAQRAESVEVICLKEGRHSLPSNVRVHSLGKESGRSRLKYVLRFWAYSWSLRMGYDSVFVHMNEEYVLLGGVLWRVLGKRIVFWRNHKMGSFLTSIAARLSSSICYTSPDSYVSTYAHAMRMPIGIDTTVFRPANAPSSNDSILFFGRLDEVKRPDVLVAALHILKSKNVRFRATICGSPTRQEDPFYRQLQHDAESLVNAGLVSFRPAIKNEEAPSMYCDHAIYVNLTPSGSFDKTIGEAMASGCVVVAANNAVQSVLSDLFIARLTPEDAALAIERALSLTTKEQAERGKNERTYIEREHSLSLLSNRLFGILAP